MASGNDYALAWEKILGPRGVLDPHIRSGETKDGRKISRGVPEEALDSFVEKVKGK